MNPEGKPRGCGGCGEHSLDRARARACQLGGEVAGMAFHPNGQLLATAGMDGVVQVWEIGSGRKVESYSGHKRSVRSLVYSPNGRFLATGGEDRTVLVRDVIENRVASIGRGHTCWVHSVTYSGDG